MKKIWFLIVIFALSLAVKAQLYVKEGSFKEVRGFVNINTEKMYDDNDKPYAVLKIKTENINDKQRRELCFQGDAATFFEVEYNVGEVWLYMSYYATFLKISHPDLSSTEFYFPFDMKPKCGYELTLVNKPAVDEDIVKRLEKLEKANNNANVEKPVEAAEKPVKVVEKPNEEIGYISVTSTPKGAFVLVDNKIVGMTPYLSEKIVVGNHKISVSLDGYEQAAKRVDVKKGKEETLDFVLVSEQEQVEKAETPRHAAVWPFGPKKKGVFSVSKDRQVVFSPGNVQRRSSKRWTFAEHQWDGGSLIDFEGMQEVVDGVWFVLSSDEWKYLLDKRKTQSGVRYVRATVNGVFGIVVLPDDWKNDNFDLKNTNISREDWMYRLEASGAVFLPAAGYRFGNWDKAVGTDGYYWSSDAVDTPYLRFNSAMLSTMTNVFDHEYGLSVRLVKER